MLVDATINGVSDPIMQVIHIMGGSPNRIGTGMYDDCGFNFGNCVDRDEWEAFWHKYDRVDPDEETIPEYGVVDSVEQFVRLFGDALEKSSRGYAVGFTTVRKADQSPSGGWRWHKWGEYFGEKTPHCEYLYDEGDDITEVVTFSVIRKRA